MAKTQNPRFGFLCAKVQTFSLTDMMCTPYLIIIRHRKNYFNTSPETILMQECRDSENIVAHGIYDAIALSSEVAPPMLAAISMPVLIWFCIKMHKNARQKVLAQIQCDKMNQA